jgi:hypothetical protein
LGATALVAASTVLADPASAAASSYQVFVAGRDGSNAEAAIKVLTMPGGTANTIDLGSGTTEAYGVAVNGAGTEAFATVQYGEGSYEVIPVTGPFTFTSGGDFNGTVGTPVLTEDTTSILDGSQFDIDEGIATSGDIVAVVNNPGSFAGGVYLFNDTLSLGQGSAADPDYVSLGYQPTAITADAAGLIAVAGEGQQVGGTLVGCESYFLFSYAPGCVSTFSVAPLTPTPTVSTALLYIGLGDSNVNCPDGGCNGAPAPGAQSIVISPATGDIYVSDSENQGVWQVNSPYSAAYGFQYLSGPTHLQAITVNSAGTTLYLSDGTDPHSYEVPLTDDVLSGPDATESADLAGADGGEPNQLGIGLTPDGSEVLVLDGDDGDGGGTAYVDEVATAAFTGAFSQYDPPVEAAGFYITASTLGVVAASSIVPITGAGLRLGLGLALVLAGLGTLVLSQAYRRRLLTLRALRARSGAGR